MQDRNYGFSLIELLVVIAIVGIVAMIATPLITTYIARARMATIVEPISDLADRMIQYANVHGVFPTAYDLGLRTTPGNSLSPENLDTISPYLEYVNIRDNSDPTPCGKHGLISGGFTNGAIPNMIDTGFNCSLFHINGSIVKYCSAYGFSLDYTTITNPMPGWDSYFSNSQYGSDAYAEKYSNFVDQTTCM